MGCWEAFEGLLASGSDCVVVDLGDVGVVVLLGDFVVVLSGDFVAVLLGAFVAALLAVVAWVFVDFWAVFAALAVLVSFSVGFLALAFSDLVQRLGLDLRGQLRCLSMQCPKLAWLWQHSAEPGVVSP